MPEFSTRMLPPVERLTARAATCWLQEDAQDYLDLVRYAIQHADALDPTEQDAIGALVQDVADMLEACAEVLEKGTFVRVDAMYPPGDFDAAGWTGQIAAVVGAYPAVARASQGSGVTERAAAAAVRLGRELYRRIHAEDDATRPPSPLAPPEAPEEGASHVA